MPRPTATPPPARGSGPPAARPTARTSALSSARSSSRRSGWSFARSSATRTTHVAARTRLVLARHPALHWWAAAACAAVVGGLTVRSTQRLASEREAWGHTRSVVVVVSPTAAGSTPRVEIRALPDAALPDATLEVWPDGAVAAHDLQRGEVVTPSDAVAPSAADGVRLAVPARGAPTLLVGQRALLLAADGTRCEGSVVASGDEWIDVAVPAPCAPVVALALLAGDLVVGALGP